MAWMSMEIRPRASGLRRRATGDGPRPRGVDGGRKGPARRGRHRRASDAHTGFTNQKYLVKPDIFFGGGSAGICCSLDPNQSRQHRPNSMAHGIDSGAPTGPRRAGRIQRQAASREILRHGPRMFAISAAEVRRRDGAHSAGGPAARAPAATRRSGRRPAGAAVRGAGHVVPVSPAPRPARRTRRACGRPERPAPRDASSSRA
jgi:hypothetical protein